MKSEPVEGVAEKLVAKAQRPVGKLIGDLKMEAEGSGHQAAGKLTKTYGDTLDSVSTFVKEKPVAALAIGAAALILINRIFRR